MYTIRKEFHFSAAHQLKGLPKDHPCSRIHGHNYIVIFELRSKKLNSVGFVKDYRELDKVKTWIDSNFDHQNLNDYFKQPSAEYIAEFLYKNFKYLIPELVAVEVKETPKTSARYEPTDN